MKNRTLVKTSSALLGLFTLNTFTACMNNVQTIEASPLDIPKLALQIGLSVAGIILVERTKKDNKDNVIGKKINRRFK